MGCEEVYQEGLNNQNTSLKSQNMAGTRREVLRLYKNIMRLGQRWEAADPIETRVEREYIVDEARYTRKH